MNKLVFLFIYGIFFFFPLHLNAEIVQYGSLFQRLENFPSEPVSALLQDDDGYLWIGTSNNLYRYNGNKFITIKKSNCGFTGGVTVLHKDNRKLIWIGTKEGLFVYDDSDIEKKYSHLTNIIKYFNKLHVTDIKQDSCGNLLIATLSGLYCIHYDLKSIVRFPIVGKHGKEETKIKTLLISSNQVCWVGTSNGLYLLNLITGLYEKKVFSSNYKKNLSVIDIKRGLNNDVWVATQSKLYKYDIKSLELVQHERTFDGQLIKSLYIDSRNILWVGTSKSLYSVNSDNEISEYFVKNNKLSNIQSFYEDRSGVLWLGSYNRGLFKRTRQNGNLYFCESGEVRSLVADKIGDIWFIDDSNLYHFDGNEKYLKDKKSFLISETMYRPRRLLVLNPEGLFVGFDEKKYTKVAKNVRLESKSIKAIPFLYGKQGSLLWHDSQRHSFIKLESDSMLVYYNYTFVDSLEVQEKKAFNLNLLSPHLVGKNVTVVTVDSHDKIWIGTEGQGLYLIYPDNTTLHIENDLDNFIRGIQEDDIGRIWVSSISSIHCFNQEGKYLVTPLKSCLDYNSFSKRAAAKDLSGYLYWGTEKGIVWFHPDSIMRLTENQIIIDELWVNNKIIEAPLDDVAKFSYPLNKTKYISLKPGMNSIRIGFSSTDYNVPMMNIFRFKLVGFDKTWRYTVGSNAYADYNHLQAGKYSLLIQTDDGIGGWSLLNQRAIEVSVIPYFYNVWWFKMMVTILLVATIICFIRKRIQFIKDKNIELQRLVDERTKEIKQYVTSLERSKNELCMQNLSLEKKNQKIQELSETKAQLFTHITHEFKTPISLIMAPLEIINSMKVTDDIQKYLDLAYRNATHLHTMVKKMVNLNHANYDSSNNISCFDLCRMLTELCNTFNSMAQLKGISLQMEVKTQVLLVLTDSEKLIVALNNLVSNAIKYTVEGGKVLVKMSLLSETNSITIEIEDNGIGIAEEDLPYIFDRFYRAKSQRDDLIEGDGIGLFLAKKNVSELGGKLVCQSRISEGTKFIISLPNSILATNNIDNVNSSYLCSIDRINGDVDTTLLSNKSNNRYKILVVEDVTELLYFLNSILEDDYEVAMAHNGKEALDILNTFDADLILSDVMMPIIDGIELCKILRHDLTRSHIPFILLTAADSNSSEYNGLSVGADDFISKPFKVDILKIKISNILQQRLRIASYLKEHLYTECNQLSTIENDFINSLQNYILSRIDDDKLSIVDIARYFCMSQSSLTRKVQKLIGITPIEYVKNLRIEYAASLLVGEKYNITECAYQAGFSSLSYFRKCFREKYCMSPKEYIIRGKK